MAEKQTERAGSEAKKKTSSTTTETAKLYVPMRESEDKEEIRKKRSEHERGNKTPSQAGKLQAVVTQSTPLVEPNRLRTVDKEPSIRLQRLALAPSFWRGYVE